MSQQLAKIWLSSSLAISMACGVCIVMMAGYLMVASPIYNTYGVDTIAKIFEFQTALGSFMTITSFLGCIMFGSRNALILKMFIVTTTLLAITQLAFGISMVYEASDDSARLCRLSRDHNSKECKSFLISDSRKISYFVWKSVWVKAAQTQSSIAAGELLQSVQDEGHCCGFGMKSACNSNYVTTKTISFLFDEIADKEKCCLLKGESNNYCDHDVEVEKISTNCQVANPWDFPYGGLGEGNNGRCLDSNMQLGRGCDTVWCEYLFKQIWISGCIWVFMGLLQINCPLSALFYLYADRKKKSYDAHLYKLEGDSLLKLHRVRA